MDILAQQKKLYSDPHFGTEKRNILAKLFGTVKSALIPSAGEGTTVNSHTPYALDRSHLLEAKFINSDTHTIFRNGVHFETFYANECACQVEVMALRKEYPHDNWSYTSGDNIKPEKQTGAAA